MALIDPLQLPQLGSGAPLVGAPAARQVTTLSPAGVSRMPFDMRSNSATPRSCSNVKIWRLIAEAAMFNSFAARWIDPDRAT